MTTTIEQLERQLALGGVAVVGAGMSLESRYPDTSGLIGLLWDAVDADAESRRRLAQKFGLSDTNAKELIGDDPARRNDAWKAVSASRDSRQRFQSGFAALDSRRASDHSASHEALARLVHRGHVELVISLNWDSALERAYERLYGVPMPPGSLHKPHGDVADPSSAWVLPHEDGVIDPSLLKRVTAIADEHPRTLVVVGYSESDRVVVDMLIAPLDARWRVCRIGPEARGTDDVQGTASQVLAELSAPLAHQEDACAWSVINFSQQRDIDAALESTRLSPRDAAACPALPEVDIVRSALLRTHAVVLNGESGSGKSITAYQTARRVQQQQHFEVLRLRDRARHSSPREWLADLDVFPGPKVVFIDDAQDLDTDRVREMTEAANPSTLVLIAGVDHVAGGVATITLASASAVAVLENYVRKNTAALLPKIRALDDRVGDGFGDEPLGMRLQQAAREPTAWQFFYTLTGGWRRTARSLEEIRGNDRADLLAGALAVAQIAGVDSGVKTETLVSFATAIGRDSAWVERNLELLLRERLAVEDDGIWRCTHLRTAYAIITWLLHPPRWNTPPTKFVEVPPIRSASRTQTPAPLPVPATRAKRTTARVPQAVIDADRRSAAALITHAINDASTSLRGLAWLLGRNFPFEAQRVMREAGLRSADIDAHLSERALATGPDGDVDMAAQLLEQLEDPDHREVLDSVWAHIDVVVGWVAALKPADGWAVGGLINSLHNDDRIALASALENVDPIHLAALVDGGGWPHIYSSMKAVNRITQSGGPALMDAVGRALDEKVLDSMLDRVPDLRSANELFGGLAYLNADLGIRLFANHAADLAHLFSPTPVDSYHDLFDTFCFLLQGTALFGRKPKPTPDARRALKAFLRAIDRKPLVDGLAEPTSDTRWMNFPEFVEMFASIDRRTWLQVSGSVDFDVLERTLVEQMPRPGTNLLFMLHVFTLDRRDEVLAMLARHRLEFGNVDALLVHVHRSLSIDLIKAGLPLDLGLYHQRYDSAAELLTNIGAESPTVAAEIAQANGEAFREGLAQNFSAPFAGLSAWIAAADLWAPGLIEDELAKLTPETIHSWASALRQRRAKREVGALIVRAAAQGSTPVATAASELVTRFPSLKSLSK